ncbi:MAG TPA: DUF3090 family protein [Candidatus Binatus sp.]|nr:DUF3090 family protein [Candidatus Dormibacteraeota bacterium]HYL41373.1 DUF3090 family protein [Candidatus Binatus sp.]
MPRRLFVFELPDRFATGTIGEPGNRAFFLQAREGRRVISVGLEKAQVAVLAERLGRLLVELDKRGIVKDPPTPIEPDEKPLDEPLNEAFRATTLTLGWDVDAEQVLIEARAPGEDDDAEAESEAEGIVELEDDDDEDGPDLLRVRLTADAARTFVERAFRVIRSGRPPCPLCGNPLDATGHICPRKNGHYVN